jgi:N-acetyl-1-D-myo-inositol-2-amino-2-deoxy-alpha-D-glucopyranoside deacetylase
MSDRRMLLVHAHPDDEAIPTGVTMAKYADAGVAITLVTCTLGEEGEVVAPELAHLASGAEDALGEHRMRELHEACELLGVSDVRLLGGPGRWRDSGMMGEATNDDPRSFWQADMREAVGELVKVIREVRPQVVITYDENGAYGHPDHIQAHRVTKHAFRAAAHVGQLEDAGEPWAASKLYYSAIPKSGLREAMEWFKQAGQPGFFEGVENVDDLPIGTPDELVTTMISAPEHTGRKLAALRAHRSQVNEQMPFFSLPPEMAERFWGVEHYTLAEGTRGPGTGPSGWEDDLFAGL